MCSCSRSCSRSCSCSCSCRSFSFFLRLKSWSFVRKQNFKNSYEKKVKPSTRPNVDKNVMTTQKWGRCYKTLFLAVIDAPGGKIERWHFNPRLIFASEEEAPPRRGTFEMFLARLTRKCNKNLKTNESDKRSSLFSRSVSGDTGQWRMQQW